MVNQLFEIAALTLVAAQAAVPPPMTRDNIVVVGVRLADLEADVARCEAGGCNVREDVIASVRFAEAMFRKGDYRRARTVLARSVSRTKKDADSDPFAVAELQTARSTIAWHYGDQREALRATAASSRLLATHAPTSPNAFLARMRLISAQAHQFGTIHTLDRLRTLSEDASAAGQPLIAMRADLGRAALLNQMKRRSDSRELLDALVASTVPGSAGLRLVAQVLQTRIAAAAGDAGAIETLIAGLTADQKRQGPVLVWSPPFPTPDGAGDIEDNSLLGEDVRSSTLVGLRWVDIGFSVGADGRVEDVEVLRGSPRPVWAKPLLGAIAQRRYTPSADIDDLAGRFRIERYTLTADFLVPKGSLIRRRAGNRRFEQMDLTTASPQG